MRKLILTFFILSLVTIGLYVTQKSQASVSTTIAAAGTPLRTLDGPLWKYPNKATNCSRSFTEPYASYTIDVATSGDYTFTMNTSGFSGGVYVYRTLFVPTNPCGNIVNGQDGNQDYITGNSVTLPLSATNPGRYVVVFTAKNIVECPNCPNQNTHSSNVNGTFSASVSGPAAVTLVQNVTSTIVDPNTPLNSQNNYSWKYPLTVNCSSLSGTVPFAAHKISVPSSGSYTFTMNTSGFAGAIHAYTSFKPDDPCALSLNPTDGTENIITGNSVTIPVTTFGSPIQMTVVFSAQNPGEGGTFSASVTGPGIVTVVPPGDLHIASEPSSKSVSKGCQQTLSVYATGPTPQTFQWYEGISGDLSTSIIIPEANSNVYTTPALNGDKSYWVRVTSGSDHVDSDTIKFKVYNGTNTPFKGSLDTIQTWNLRTTSCNQPGPNVHYRAIHFRIPVSGNYRVHLNSHTFPGQYAITEYDFMSTFDATQPCLSFGGGVTNSDLTNHFVGGQDVIFVISATTPGALGDFDGYITSNDSCTLPETVEDALIISGHPLDQAVTPGNSATLTFAYNGGSNGNKSIQWYKGASGDTSQPIANANSPTYITPPLSQTNNETTYYYYWARVDDPDSFTHADTGSAVVSVITPPITYSDVLTACDEQYAQVSGPVTYYKIFPFKVSVTGAYTFSVSANGFTPFVALYHGFFSATYPNLNYAGPGGTQTLLGSPSTYYLVITTTGAGQTGSFTLNINGPALVVPSLRPQITTQPTDKVVLRDQTTTLNVTANSPVVSYQWFTGTCTNKTPVSGGNLSSYTTPPMTDYKDYWVKVSYGVMYVNSNIAHVRIKPQAILDPYIIDEDTPLNVAAPGLLANDKKADSKTLKPFKVSEPTLGTRTLNDDGSMSYTPMANVNGPDVFQYKVSDGTLESEPENVGIVIRAINDPPVFTGGSFNNHTFNEDDAIGTLHLGGVSFGPGGGADEATQQLTYKVTAVPPASMGSVVLADNTTVVTTNTTYTLTQIRGMGFKPAVNGFGGPAQFTVTVTDNGESYTGPDPKSITKSLDITVNAVADIPSATTAITDEDMKTISGLVLSRNANDGAEVTHFRIAVIKNGTLYKNDGTTQITNGQFITYAEGHTGLKFSPNANLFSPTHPFSFEVQASLSNAPSGVGENVFTATITVNPVAELPSVTSATTFVNLQTTSGLVITRNPLDGAEIGYFKISSITNGTLYKTDGNTQISEGQYITVAEGSAGLKFTPAQDSTVPGSFVVRGAATTQGNGLGSAAAANITVNKHSTSTSITSVSPAPSYLNQPVTVSYSVLNTSGGPTPAGNVVVAVSGGSETCTATVATGSCTLTLTTGGNPRTLTATYVGNGNFENSTGTTDHVVNACTQNTVVTSTADDGTSGTLRYMVNNACEGSTITFDPTVFNPAGGPYLIALSNFGSSGSASQLLINRNLNIIGPGANILTLRRSTLSRTQHFRIFNIASGATVTISGLSITDGFANGGVGANDADGGGILNSGTLTLNSCVVSGNQAGREGLSNGSGGGIYNTGTLTVINSTISGNNAFISNGGGIFVQNGSTANIINSTISGNTAANNGGGIAVSGAAKIINTTIASNTGTVSGGGIYNQLGATDIRNSVVAGNTSPGGPDVLLNSGTIKDNGHNLIRINDGAETTFWAGLPNSNGDIVGTSASPVLALLGDLADNGGATQTHLPLPGSPALDAGSNAKLPQDTFDLDSNTNTTEPLPIDQRGQARITNTTVDIGAIEVSYSVTATSGSGQSAMINSSFAAPLQATVTEAGKPKGGTSVTFTAPEIGAGGLFNGNSSTTVITDNNGVATAPAFTANGIAGTYSVTASLNGGTFSSSFTLTNTPGPAQVMLGALTYTYDGTSKNASATTVPMGLAVTLTYDGSTTPPSNAGSYQVVAIISDPNYSGQTTGTLNIGKAGQTINFVAPANKTVADAPFALNANATSGLPVTYTVVSGPASITGNVMTLTGSGTVVVRAAQAGDVNHNPALSVDQSFDVNKIQATLTLSNLSQTYDGTTRRTTVTTNPPNLNTVIVRYSQNGTAVSDPTNAGNYDVVASLNSDDYQASDTAGTLVIARATQSISFDALTNKTYGDADFTVGATASSELAVSFSTTGKCNISANTVHLTSAGSCTVTASQSGNENYAAANPVSQSFTINKATAGITLGSLSQNYDGTARVATTTTNPAGLNVTLTFNGSATAPVNAGSYTVVATINDPNYEGSATDQLIIKKATAAITLSNLSQNYDGTARVATTTTNPTGLAVTLSFNGSPAAPVNAGSYAVVATINDPNYEGSATDQLVIKKATAGITLSNLSQNYDGTPKVATATTNPTGLDVTFSFNGSAPINAGSYTIVATINDPNYEGSATDQLVIKKATAAITLGNLSQNYDGTARVATATTNPAGLNVTLAFNGSPAAPVNAGNYTVVATINDPNYEGSATDQLVIKKATAAITLGNLSQNYDGTARVATATTNPAGLNVTLAFNGSPADPVNAGNYTVVATINDPNYEGSATDQLIINKATSVINWSNPSDIIYGTALSGAHLNATASLPGTFGYTPAIGTVLNAGNSQTLSVTFTPTDAANYNTASKDVLLNVLKATQRITFGQLSNKTYGDADFTVGATTSSGLGVSFGVLSGPASISESTVRLTGAGTVTIQSTQPGDANFNAATPVDQTFVVARAATITALTSSANPAQSGQTVTFTATVTSPAGTPTGSIQLKANGTDLGSAVALNTSGTASINPGPLPAGTHTITAVYSGDTNFATSNGALSDGQVVNNNLPVFSFGPSSYNVNEIDGFIRVTVNRTGDIGAAVKVDYATDDTGAPADCQTLNSNLASARCDLTPMFGTLIFAANERQKTLDIPINQDSYLEGPEVFRINLSNPGGGAVLVTPSSAIVTINDSEAPAPNAIDDTTAFVRQQYHDFLNREPDPAGLAFWKNNIDKCNDPQQRQPDQTLDQCVEVQRILTSAAFFLSIEFRQTGGLVRDFYVAALDRPVNNNMPGFIEFERDTQNIQRELIVEKGNWQQTLNNNRVAFMNDFVMRAEFVGLYPTTDTPALYVDKLYLHAGVTPETPTERAAAIAEFGTAASAADAEARGRALLRITQNATFQSREINRSFVQMEYVGYLRRNPPEAPDNSFAGYDFWVNKLSQFSGDFLQAEMIKAFLSSAEYRQRFGQ